MDGAIGHQGACFGLHQHAVDGPNQLHLKQTNIIVYEVGHTWFGTACVK